jgi:hypothetical protein
MNRIPAMLHSVLGFVLGVLLFLLLFGGILWLMVLMEPRHFTGWFV